MAKHILNIEQSKDKTEMQILLFDDSSNTFAWIKAIPSEKPIDFKSTK